MPTISIHHSWYLQVMRVRPRLLNRRLMSMLVLTMSLAGCGGNSTPTSPTTSSPASPAGNWSGSLSDPLSGEGTMRLSLGEQSTNALSGTWSATFRNGDSVSGPAAATLVQPNAYGIVLYVDPQPPCTTTGNGASALLGYTLINVVATSRQLTAVLGRTSCSGFGFGTIELSRQ